MPPDLPGNADARSTGAVDDGAAVAKFLAADTGRCMHGGSRNRPGALDIVIERRQMVAVAVQDLEGDVLVEILPLDDDLGENRACRLDELVDDGEIRIATQAVLAPPQVPGIVEQLLVVGANVEADRQGARRMNAGSDAIERQLADTDRHAADTLVTDAQYGLVVGDDHEFDVAERRRITQYLLDPTRVAGCDEHTPRPTINMGIKMRGGTDGRRIDHGHQLLEMRAQYLVEQHLVTVLQQAEIDVPADGILVETDRVIGAVGLHLDVVVLRRQHAFDTETAALLRSKADAFVVDRCPQQLGTAQVYFYLVAFRRSDQFELFHDCARHPCG